MAAEFVEDPVRRQRYRFAREGDVLRVDAFVKPGGDVPPHYHPSLEERFEVVAGNVRFRVAGRTQIAGPGERLAVPPGVKHSFKNTGSEEAHIRVEAEPAMDLQQFLEEAAALARAGKYTRLGIPTGFRAALEAAAFTERYRETAVVTLPPPALVAPLARLARRRGVAQATS